MAGVSGGFLIDLDGTVYQGSALVDGAERAIARLRHHGTPFLFTTNTSRRSRRDVVAALAGMGLRIAEDEVLTAPVAAALRLREDGCRRIHLLLPESTHADFADFEITDVDPEAVLVGDVGEGFTFARLNAAFRSLRRGARLIAIHRNRYWIPDTEPVLDAGPFVAALEYAARTEALLVGKPAPAFFEAAAARLGVPAETLAVVGDDMESDIRGARTAGLTAILVRTGKFDQGLLDAAAPGDAPHHVIDSIAELPAALAGDRG